MYLFKIEYTNVNGIFFFLESFKIICDRQHNFNVVCSSYFNLQNIKYVSRFRNIGNDGNINDWWIKICSINIKLNYFYVILLLNFNFYKYFIVFNQINKLN